MSIIKNNIMFTFSVISILSIGCLASDIEEHKEKSKILCSDADSKTSRPSKRVKSLCSDPDLQTSKHVDSKKGNCKGYGPQTPRDIDSLAGGNDHVFAMAADYKEMNLCNIHFHENAEHKAKDFSIYAGDGDHGYGGGYKCNMSQNLSADELKPTQEKICKSKHGDLVPGDTIEVHWVFSSCDIKPGDGLGSCVSKSCANPNLRVETQVFTLVNDSSALNWNDLVYDGNIVNGLHQPKALPENTGKPVEFIGSTTGPKYSDSECSPYQVSWSVRPKCAKLDINTLGKWCADGNEFSEDHAHGVRKLVTDPGLLSEIK